MSEERGSALERLFKRGAKVEPSEIPAVVRITSYNVCYTKLLRVHVIDGVILPS